MFNSRNGSPISQSDAASNSSRVNTVAPKEEANEKRLLLEVIQSGPLRQILFQAAESKFFSYGILFVITLNTAVLALQSVHATAVTFGWFFTVLDDIFLGLYIMEALTKLYTWRMRYFKDPWNNFDLLIVIASLAPTVLRSLMTATTSINSEILQLLRVFKTFRALRSLRVLRTIKFIKSLQVVVAMLLRSIPAMGNISVLTLLVIYMFSVIGKTLFSDTDPYNFGSFGMATWTLFQLATLDNWSKIYNQSKHNEALMFPFVFVYIILVSFVFINLFVAVIVDNMQAVQALNRKNNSHALQTDDDNYNFDRGSRKSLTTGSIKLNSELVGTSLREELGIENYYSHNMPPNAKKDVGRYLALLASLEHLVVIYDRQQKMLEDLADLANRDPAAGK